MTGNHQLKEQIRAFWDSRPCDAELSTKPVGSRAFYEEIRECRYAYEHHIPLFADFALGRGKKVLEIGLGVGTDTVEFARHGAMMHGIDLSPQAVGITKRNLETVGLSSDLRVGDAETLPYPDNYFDLVYSFGVLLCIPNISRAIEEVHRVLRPGGCAKIMLYHKHSYNYWINIRLFRRLGAGVLRLPWGPQLVSSLTRQPLHVLMAYKNLFEKHKRFDNEFFVRQNTDGPGNPYSSVYTRREAGELFKAFRVVRQRTWFLNKRYLPVIGRLMSRKAENWISRVIGWHLCITAYK